MLRRLRSLFNYLWIGDSIPCSSCTHAKVSWGETLGHDKLTRSASVRLLVAMRGPSFLPCVPELHVESVEVRQCNI